MLFGMAHRTVRSAAADQSSAANRAAARRAGLGERLRQLRVAGRPHADRSRGRPVLQGVHLADRARQDAPDDRDGRVARAPARRRCGLPRDRRLGRRPRQGRGDPRARRRAHGRASLRRVARGVRACAAVRRLDRRRGAARARPERRGDGASRTGDITAGLALLAESRSLVESDGFSDVDRAEVLYRMGVCRYKLSSISTALGLFNEALALVERTELPSDELRLNIFEWRSRCYRRQRDYEAAREDVEHALELAEALRDIAPLADVYFQASLPRRARRSLGARAQLRRAGEGALRGAVGSANVGRLLNNLGVVEFLLGKPDGGGRALQAGVRDRARDRPLRGRRRRGLVARAGASPHGRHRPRRGAGTPRARDHRRARRHARPDRATPVSSSAARCSSRAGSTRRKRSSPRPRTRSRVSRPPRIAPPRGSRRAIWPTGGVTTARAAVLYRRAAEALQDFRF